VNPRLKLALTLSTIGIAGCAVIPSGPSMLVLPGTGRPFDQFQVDDSICRRYAYELIGGSSAQQAANDSAALSALAGTAVGAAAGAAFGGSQGAAVGAGTGLLFGSAVGTGTATMSAREMQRRYDNAYVQCMYAKGHRVPVPDGSGYGWPAAYPSAPPGTVRAPSATTAPAPPGSVSPPASSTGLPQSAPAPSDQPGLTIPPPPPGLPPPPPGSRPG